VNVDASNSGSYVSAYGPGLVQGVCGGKLEFFVARGSNDSAFISFLCDHCCFENCPAE